MPMTPDPIYAQTPKTNTAVVTAAITGLTTDNVVGAQLLFTAGSLGSAITRITAIPRGTASANSLLLFLSKEGTTFRLFDSELLPAYAAATNVAIPETTFSNVSLDTPMFLEAGDRIYVGAQVAQATGIVVKIEARDF